MDLEQLREIVRQAFHAVQMWDESDEGRARAVRAQRYVLAAFDELERLRGELLTAGREWGIRPGSPLVMSLPPDGIAVDLGIVEDLYLSQQLDMVLTVLAPGGKHSTHTLNIHDQVVWLLWAIRQWQTPVSE